MQLEDSPDEPRTFACADCQTLRSGRAKKNNGGCQNCGKQQRKAPEIDPMEEQEPVAAAEPPVRPRNERPRRVKAAPQSAEPKPAVPSPQAAPGSAGWLRPAAPSQGRAAKATAGRAAGCAGPAH